MRSEFAFLFPAPVKVKKARKPAAKAIRVGAAVIINGQTLTVVERDTRYSNAWFVADETGKRAPYSFSRDMIKVI